VSRVVAWRPQPGPQTEFITCPAEEILYGGAVGGGKSDGLLGDWVVGAEEFPGKFHGVLFRKHFPDMDDIIRRSREIFGPVYGDKCYNSSKYQWTLPNGSTLRFRALENDDDVYKYHGQQFTWVGWDELTQWSSPFAYTYMMTRSRSAHGAAVRTRAATNPGGVGHAWVKARFIDPAPPKTPMLIKTRSGGTYTRIFIPAKLDDNRILMKNDPGYADRVYELNDQRLAEALRNGNWDIVVGAAFTEWSPSVHVIQTEDPPTDRPVFCSMDWGYKTPYGNLWGFVDNEARLVLCGELYAWTGKINVGTEESPEEVRKKLEAWESSRYLRVWDRSLDPQCWEDKNNSVSTAARLGGRDLGWKPWPKGPNSRVNQKQGIHQLLAVTNGRSRFAVMDCCRHFIRTIPTLPMDKKKPEDIDTMAEDHLYDAWRGMVAKRFPSKQEMDAIRRNEQRAAAEHVAGYSPEYGGW